MTSINIFDFTTLNISCKTYDVVYADDSVFEAITFHGNLAHGSDVISPNCCLPINSVRNQLFHQTGI